MPRIYKPTDKGRWGHDWFITDKVTFWFADGKYRPQSVRLAGWLTPLPAVGDEFQIAMQSGRTARLVVVKVKPCGDPHDMFFADAELRGCTEGEWSPEEESKT